MYESLSAYWKFLKRPRLLRFSKDKAQLKKDFFYLLILDYIIAFLVLSALSVLLHYKLVKAYPFMDLEKEFGIWLTGVLMCMGAPLFEEGIFRYQLRKRMLSIYFIAFALACIVISNLTNDYLKFFTFIAFLGLAIGANSWLGSMSKIRGYKVWQKLYGYFFYLTALVFAYAHLSNIKGLTIADPSFIFYISAQLFAGLSLGYLRIKYGLIYSILFHAAYNGLLFLLMAFS